MYSSVLNLGIAIPSFMGAVSAGLIGLLSMWQSKRGLAYWTKALHFFWNQTLVSLPSPGIKASHASSTCLRPILSTSRWMSPTLWFTVMFQPIYASNRLEYVLSVPTRQGLSTWYHSLASWLHQSIVVRPASYDIPNTGHHFTHYSLNMRCYHDLVLWFDKSAMSKPSVLSS